MARLKVYGGLILRQGETIQTRAVVATTSYKRLAVILNESVYYVRGYWSEAGNKDEIDAAMANPETIVFLKQK